jgi:hypothetical protein
MIIILIIIAMIRRIWIIRSWTVRVIQVRIIHLRMKKALSMVRCGLSKVLRVKISLVSKEMTKNGNKKIKGKRILNKIKI